MTTETSPLRDLPLPLRGRCQCGRVSLECRSQPFVAYTCHCLECQRQSSSAFNTCLQVAAEAVEILSGVPRARVRTADSGNILSSHFCSDCGSTVYSQNSARPRIRTLYVGTLDDAARIAVSAHIWVKRKLPWVQLPAQHRIFEEAGDWRTDYASDITRYQPALPGAQ